MFSIAITDHVEGPIDRPSVEIFNEVREIVELADSLGVSQAFFAEHHAHAHFGHLPTPLLLAMDLAARTKQIQLGSAIICTPLHRPLEIAEQIAVIDVLTNGRLAPGFGSGATPAEMNLFNAETVDDSKKHERLKAFLTTMRDVWRRAPAADPSFATTCAVASSTHVLPQPLPDLESRCWCAVNSVGAARVAGEMNFSVLFSHLRTIDQYCEYRKAYRLAGGTGKIAINRPVLVAESDEQAFAIAEPVVRKLWRRFQGEGKFPADAREPKTMEERCGHPINFIVGGPQRVAKELLNLHRAFEFDVANLEFRWAEMSHDAVLDSVRLMMSHAIPMIKQIKNS